MGLYHGRMKIIAGSLGREDRLRSLLWWLFADIGTGRLPTTISWRDLHYTSTCSFLSVLLLRLHTLGFLGGIAPSTSSTTEGIILIYYNNQPT